MLHQVLLHCISTLLAVFPLMIKGNKNTLGKREAFYVYKNCLQSYKEAHNFFIINLSGIMDDF